MSESALAESASASTGEIQKTPRRAWAVLAVTFLASLGASMSQFKITAIASWIIPMYDLTGVTLGYLMSALSIFGVILAIPAAFIVRKWGLKNSMLVSIGFLILGAVVAAMTSSLPLLYASRVLEGVGLGLIGVAAPSCVSVWFPDKTRGFALGIQALWVPLGLVILYNTAPHLVEPIGVSGVFWCVAALSIVAFIAFFLVFKMPEGKIGDVAAEGGIVENLKLLKNKYMWILALAFFSFNFLQLGFINVYYNTFLETARGFTAQQAASMTGWITFPGVFLIPLFGAIFDRVKLQNRRYIMVLGFLMVIASMFFAFSDSPIGIWVFIILLGCAGGPLGGSYRAMVPLIMRGGAMSITMGMALMQVFQNFGSLAAPVYGYFIDNVSWASCGVLTVVCHIVALVLVLFLGGKAFGAKREKEAQAAKFEL